METTACIFSFNKAECNGKKRTHLTHLMCANHLRDIFGLEMTYFVFETEMSHEFVGGFLKPTPGVIFKANAIIIPERNMFDKFYRPEEIQKTPDDEP